LFHDLDEEQVERYLREPQKAGATEPAKYDLTPLDTRSQQAAIAKILEGIG